MKLYISGPMTGLPEYNFPAFNEAADTLRALGFEIENPADKGVIDGWEWEDYLRYDLKALMDCAGIATLAGHEKSKGAVFELYVGSTLGMPIRKVRDWASLRVLSGV